MKYDWSDRYEIKKIRVWVMKSVLKLIYKPKMINLCM